MSQAHEPENLHAVLDRCHELGMRVSPQRKAILSLLCGVEDHLNAGDIYQRLRTEGQPVGYSSVYQNLEALARSELIEVIHDPRGNRYGWRPDPHHHFHCSECGTVLDVDLPNAELLLSQVEGVQGKVTQCRINLYGICAQCGEKA